MYRLTPLRLLRHYSSKVPSRVRLERQTERALLRVSGCEVANFLQGLITNDIAHLGNLQTSLFTMFLNIQGRVLFDAIIYKQGLNNTFLIECDVKASEALQKHLKLYRVRRKIYITDVDQDELELFALYSFGEIPKRIPQTNDFQLHPDPRLPKLGFRILAKPGLDLKAIFQASKPLKENFRYLRYNLGIGEGVDELPPGDCFPLECNCDYLHGVSFHKGCYIGQELTARIHHTGVIRKRLVPIFFNKIPNKVEESKIVHENSSLGKLRGIEQNVGLGLLRFEKAKGINFKVGDGEGYTITPSWWPIEAPKEINVHKMK